jgi:hypothetical protein
MPLNITRGMCITRGEAVSSAAAALRPTQPPADQVFCWLCCLLYCADIHAGPGHHTVSWGEEAVRCVRGEQQLVSSVTAVRQQLQYSSLLSWPRVFYSCAAKMQKLPAVLASRQFSSMSAARRCYCSSCSQPLPVLRTTVFVDLAISLTAACSCVGSTCGLCYCGSVQHVCLLLLLLLLFFPLSWCSLRLRWVL